MSALGYFSSSDPNITPSGCFNRFLNGDFAVSPTSGSVADGATIFQNWRVLTQSANVTVSQLTAPEPGQTFALRIVQANATAQRFGFSQTCVAADSYDLRTAFVSLAGRLRASYSGNIRFALLSWPGTADSVTADIVNDWTSESYTPGQFFISSVEVINQGVFSGTAETWASLPVIPFQCPDDLNNLIGFVWTEDAVSQNGALDAGAMQCALGQAQPSFEHRPYYLEQVMSTQQGGGYLLAANNLDDVDSVPTSRGNLGFPSSVAANGVMIGNTGATAFVQTAQGAAGTVLHGNGASAPTFSAVSLTADVSGVLPIANGGTNANTAAGAATNLGLGTGDSPQFLAINLGSASDTTITRVSAGVIAVEGDTVAMLAAAQTFSAAQSFTGALSAKQTDQAMVGFYRNDGTLSYTAGRSVAGGNSQNFFIYDNIATAQRMQINSSGAVTFGTSTTFTRQFNIDGQDPGLRLLNNGNGNAWSIVNGLVSPNDNIFAIIYDGSAASVLRCDPATGGGITPGSDNVQTCGASSFRWTVVYATTGTINTSDEEEKDDITPLSDAVLDAWEKVEWVSYRWKDAKAQKGDGARIHAGLIAQRVEKAFRDSGLDPFTYGVLCRDDLGDGQWRYGVRYEEAFALESACMRRAMKRLAEKI